MKDTKYAAFYADGSPVKRDDTIVSAHNGCLYEFKSVSWDSAHKRPMVRAINVDRDTSVTTVLSPSLLQIVVYAV